jgi:hypothetical protein
VRYSLILRNRRKWRHNFLTLGDNSLEIRRQGGDEVLHAINEWQSIDRRTSIFNNCMAGKGYYKVTERTQRKSSQQLATEQFQREMKKLNAIEQSQREMKNTTKPKLSKHRSDKDGCSNLTYDELMNPPERCIIRYNE